jgi:hypothetical protein
MFLRYRNNLQPSSHDSPLIVEMFRFPLNQKPAANEFSLAFDSIF